MIARDEILSCAQINFCHSQNLHAHRQSSLRGETALPSVIKERARLVALLKKQIFGRRFPGRLADGDFVFIANLVQERFKKKYRAAGLTWNRHPGTRDSFPPKAGRLRIHAAAFPKTFSHACYSASLPPRMSTENPPFLWQVEGFSMDSCFCIAHEKPFLILKLLAGEDF